MAGEECVIFWLREDLRLADNPALRAAARSGLPVVPLFVEGWDDGQVWSPGATSRWWRARSLQRLAAGLAELGLPLLIREGPVERVLGELAQECRAATVYANRLPTPAGEESERRAGSVLATQGRRLELFRERCLFDWRRLDAGRDRPHRVFTPFWKACLRLGDPPRPMAAGRCRRRRDHRVPRDPSAHPPTSRSCGHRGRRRRHPPCRASVGRRPPRSEMTKREDGSRWVAKQRSR